MGRSEGLVGGLPSITFMRHLVDQLEGPCVDIFRIGQNALESRSRGPPPVKMEAANKTPSTLAVGIARILLRGCLAGLEATWRHRQIPRLSNPRGDSRGRATDAPSTNLYGIRAFEHSVPLGDDTVDLWGSNHQELRLFSLLGLGCLGDEMPPPCPVCFKGLTH